MGGIINAYIASLEDNDKKSFFIQKVQEFDMFVTTNKEYNAIEIGAMFDKLEFQRKNENDFFQKAVAKSSIGYLTELTKEKVKYSLKRFKRGRKKEM